MYGKEFGLLFWTIGLTICLGVILFKPMNNDDNKVYYPETIADTQFPVSGNNPQTLSVTDQQASSHPSQSSNPSSISDFNLPAPVIAHETLSSALNTKSRKILGNFDLADQGAIRIGKYTPGVNGEIDLTSGGITALDQSGNTTFSIDGDTGNAVFAGEIQAGDVTVIDEEGLVSLASFSSGSVDNSSHSFTTLSATYVDVTDSGNPMQLNLTLKRTTHILIGFYGTIVADDLATGAGNVGGAMTVNIDGVDQTFSAQFFNSINNLTTSLKSLPTIGRTRLYTLGAGTHVIKLRARGDTTANFSISGIELFYVGLGS